MSNSLKVGGTLPAMMKKNLLTLTLSVALLTPVCFSAQDHDRDRDDHRDRDDRHHLYDKRHKDYHDWNDNEDRAYHMYWDQRHQQYVDWDRASERQRQAYWDWRHRHSDAVLQINVH